MIHSSGLHFGLIYDLDSVKTSGGKLVEDKRRQEQALHALSTLLNQGEISSELREPVTSQFLEIDPDYQKFNQQMLAHHRIPIKSIDGRLATLASILSFSKGKAPSGTPFRLVVNEKADDLTWARALFDGRYEQLVETPVPRDILAAQARGVIGDYYTGKIKSTGDALRALLKELQDASADKKLELTVENDSEHPVLKEVKILDAFA